jgi:hypothetical protein
MAATPYLKTLKLSDQLSTTPPSVMATALNPTANKKALTLRMNSTNPSTAEPRHPNARPPGGRLTNRSARTFSSGR